MSSKRINKRKSKVSEEFVSERHSKRISDRNIRKTLSIQSDNNNTNNNSDSIDSTPNISNTSISQYFPTQKNSPRNSSKLSTKFTKIKAKLFTDESEQNPISYGFEDSFEEEYNHRLNKNTIVSNKIENKNKNIINDNKLKVKLDLNKFLTNFETIMDEVIDEEVEQNVSPMEIEYDYNNDYIPDESYINFKCNSDSVLSSIACNDTNIEQTFDNKVIYNNEEEFDLDNDPIFDDIISKIDVKDLQFSDNKDVFKKTAEDNCEEFDFDDSFEQMLAEMPIPEIERKKELNSEDDGFESDGDFDLMVSKLTNNDLIKQNVQKSKTNTSISYSSADGSRHSSTSLLSLSQIIKLINTPP